ncbi:hypothetical protein E2P81_ATG03664 [Venturia nashicola]|nr:hypothetical protein E2P81_ATG03664 [Venturia nashicola]
MIVDPKPSAQPLLVKGTRDAVIHSGLHLPAVLQAGGLGLIGERRHQCKPPKASKSTLHRLADIQQEKETLARLALAPVISLSSSSSDSAAAFHTRVSSYRPANVRDWTIDWWPHIYARAIGSSAHVQAWQRPELRWKKNLNSQPVGIRGIDSAGRCSRLLLKRSAFEAFVVLVVVPRFIHLFHIVPSTAHQSWKPKLSQQNTVFISERQAESDCPEALRFCNLTPSPMDLHNTGSEIGRMGSSTFPPTASNK